jgi:phospholipid/cholesterol/gamma-HCH transport system substrate-binding protein
VLAIVAATVVLIRVTDGGGYDLTLYFESSSQLVKGNEVKVGGVPIGTVKSIELTDDFRARVQVELDEDDEAVPLRRGTVAAIRADALASVAGRYIALSLGPADAAEIPDGGEIDTDKTRSTVDTDQVFASLDAKTRRDVRSLIRDGAQIFDGKASGQANATIGALPPAGSQGAALARELAADERALTRILRESGDVVSALASRPDDLERLTGDALAATREVAQDSAALDSSLLKLPPTLRSTNTTLVNLRSAIGDLRPLMRDTRPAARPLADTLTRLSPVVRRAGPVVRDLRAAIRRDGRANDLTDALTGFAPVERQAVPAFRSTERLLGDLQPVVTELRPYVPELVGFTQGFGGTSAGYYDAHGRYARISLQASLFTLDGAGALVPITDVNGVAGLRRHIDRRCPGAATQPLPDGSNPFFEVPGTCDPGDTPR